MGKKRIFRILFIEKIDIVRQRLVDRHLKSFRAHYRNYRAIPSRAKSINQAKERVEDLIEKSTTFDLVVFSQDFPEKERDSFRQWLSFQELATPFVIIKLPEPTLFSPS